MREVVAVLRGGPSSEYEVSLRSGATVLEALNKEKYNPRDIFIDRSGIWHTSGLPASPTKALQGVDVVFNALHGEYGEDGKVQKIMDAIGVPYTGSDAQASALAFNKHLTRKAAAELGVKVPHALLLLPEGDSEKIAVNIFRSFPHPAIIKPVVGGSSLGITLANTFPALYQGIKEAKEQSIPVLVEEYIKGREATVGVVDSFRNEDTYALMPVEIIPPAHRPFFDYHAKYSGESIERVPSNFHDLHKEQFIALAKKIHSGLGLSHYSRSDFIVNKRGIFFLEVNTLPGLTKESLLPKALAAAGARLSDFVDHIISLALNKKK